MRYDPRPSDCSELTTEDNRTPIVTGMRLYNYYDCEWGVVGEIHHYDGWFDFKQDNGRTTSLNGVRVSTKSF